MKRTLKISLALTVVILVALGGWIAGSKIKSPAEAAARTAPPRHHRFWSRSRSAC